jgi:hypothetical protein
MNVSVLQRKDYVNRPRFEGRKNKANEANHRPLAGNPKHEWLISGLEIGD